MLRSDVRYGLAVRDISAASEIDIDVPGPKLLGEFASQKLIDRARYFRFIAEELVEFARLEDERSHAILGNDGRCRGIPSSSGSGPTRIMIVLRTMPAIIVAKIPAIIAR